MKFIICTYFNSFTHKDCNKATGIQSVKMITRVISSELPYIYTKLTYKYHVSPLRNYETGHVILFGNSPAGLERPRLPPKCDINTAP